MELANKITIKEVCGKIDIIKLVEHHKEHPGETLWLAEIIGIANRAKPGVTVLPDGKPSEWVKFFGNFKGTELATGKIVRSGVCMLPGSAPALLFGALEGGATAVNFGFRIGVLFDDTAAVKYRFKVDSMMPVAENDPLALLENQLKQPQLAAPAIDINAAEAARAANQQPAVVEPAAAAGKGGRRAA